MNKRQKKKRITEILRRAEFTGSHFVFSGRGNGKLLFREAVLKIILSKKYEPFKQLKKEYRKLYVAVDYSNGRDHTAKCYYQFVDGVQKIVKFEYE